MSSKKIVGGGGGVRRSRSPKVWIIMIRQGVMGAGCGICFTSPKLVSDGAACRGEGSRPEWRGLSLRRPSS
jgi:hypothetical protein